MWVTKHRKEKKKETREKQATRRGVWRGESLFPPPQALKEEAR
jgi:hypothetical protein